VTEPRLPATKFVVPALPGGDVPRPRLHVALDTAAGLPLTVVADVPGAGKSVMLESWLHDRPGLRPTWFSCDARDADPAAFWLAVSAAWTRSVTSLLLLTCVGPSVTDAAGGLSSASASRNLAAVRPSARGIAENLVGEAMAGLMVPRAAAWCAEVNGQAGHRRTWRQSRELTHGSLSAFGLSASPATRTPVHPG